MLKAALPPYHIISCLSIAQRFKQHLLQIRRAYQKYCLVSEQQQSPTFTHPFFFPISLQTPIGWRHILLILYKQYTADNECLLTVGQEFFITILYFRIHLLCIWKKFDPISDETQLCSNQLRKKCQKKNMPCDLLSESVHFQKTKMRWGIWRSLSVYISKVSALPACLVWMHFYFEEWKKKLNLVFIKCSLGKF